MKYVSGFVYSLAILGFFASFALSLKPFLDRPQDKSAKTAKAPSKRKRGAAVRKRTLTGQVTPVIR